MGKYDARILANYIIYRTVKLKQYITNLQLQKILYFLWIENFKLNKNELFSNRVFAWQLGPVITDVYNVYKSYGCDVILEFSSEDCDRIDMSDKYFIDEIVEFYSKIPTYRLVDISHVKDGAWDVIYNQKNAKGFVIPFGLMAKTGK